MTETVQLASITASTGDDASPVPPSVVKYIPVPPPNPRKGMKTHPKKPKAALEVLTIQDCLMVDIQNPKTMASARAQCARAWDVLEDRKRILRGKGLPRPVEPREKPKQKQPRSSFTESAGPVVVPSVPVSSKPDQP